MPYCHDHAHRVPYRDCTPQGLLRPRHYLDYFKAARVHALRALGVRYRALEDDGILMPVVDASVSSPHPVRYDALLTIRACFPRELSARITTGYTVFPNQETDAEDALATGRVVVCFVSTETRRPIPPPETVQRALRHAEPRSKGGRSARVA